MMDRLFDKARCVITEIGEPLEPRKFRITVEIEATAEQIDAAGGTLDVLRAWLSEETVLSRYYEAAPRKMVPVKS